MKKTLSLLLALILSLSLLALPASAAGDDLLIMSAPSATAPTHQSTAEALKYLGLFRGSDKGFELDRAPTRMEAIIMLIRLLGKESAIYGDEMGNPHVHPFTDAPGWQDANEYLGYAYTAGLTNGTSATTFEPDAPASAQMIATFTLRALGYTDTDEAKIWDIWETKAAEIGLTTAAAGEVYTRGDAVMLYWNALYCKVIRTEEEIAEELPEQMLYEHLYITPETMDNAKIVRSGEYDLATDDLATILTFLYAKTPNAFYNVYYSTLDKNDPEPYNLTKFIGSTDIAFKEGIGAEPMMGSQAHSIALMRMEDGANLEDAMATMKATVDPRRWLCVGVDPENVRAVSVDNMILLVVDHNSQQFIDTFLSMAK